MADIAKTIEIIFQGDDRVSGTIAGVADGFDKFSAVVDTIASPLAAVGDAILKVDAALATMAVAGLALAIKASGDFGDSFGEISTLLEIVDEDLLIFKGDILAYARDSGKSIEDINSAVYTAISAGIDYSDALDLLAISEKLSIGGRAELESTTRLLVSTLNAYGASTDNAERYSDVFFTTVKLGQTTISEMAGSLARVTGLAASTKVPIETLSAALAALTATGMPTAEAITGLRGILTALIKPTKEAQDMAEGLGIKFGVGAIKAGGLEGVLWDVYEATGGNTDEMAKLFTEVEGLNAALILAGDTSGKFKNALDAMAAASGATEIAYKKMADEFSIINQGLANNIKVTLIGIGDEVIPAYSDIVREVSNVFAAIGTAVDEGAFDPLFTAIDDFGRKVSAFLGFLAEAMPEAFEKIDWSDLLAALGSLGDELKGFFDDLDLTDPDDLAKAFQGVVDTITSLVTITEGMVEMFKPVWESIKEGISRINELDTESQKSFGNVLAAAQLVVNAGILITGAMVAIQASGADIKRVFDVVIGSIRALWSTLEVAFGTVADLVTKALLGIVTGLEAVVGMVGFNELETKLGGVRKSLENLKDAILLEQMEDFQELVGGASQALGGLAGSAGEATEALGDIPISVEVDIPSMEATKDAIDQAAPDAKTVDVTVDTDTASVTAARRTIAEAIPDAKAVKIEAEINVAQIEVQAAIVQTALEWDAKVNIAEVEAEAVRVTAMFESLSIGIESTGELLSGLWSTLAGGGLDLTQRWELEDLLEDENRRREGLFELQKDLIEAETKLREARAVAVERGEAVITIDGAGLQPHLEAFMFEVLEAIQVRASAEGSEFLLGL